MNFIYVLFLCMLLSACGPSTVNQLIQNTDAKQSTPGEILLMAKGNTLFLHGHKVSTYLYFDESGSVYGLDIFNHKDIGRWDVSEQGELCFKMNDWWMGQLRCFPVYHDDNKFYLFNTSNVLEFTADFFEGDRKNLFYTIKKSNKTFLMAPNTEKEAGTTSSTAAIVPPAQPNENTLPSASPSDDELRSTVKWMARDCPGCNLAEADLSGAELIGAKLQGANLSGANLSKANLRRADLKEAKLVKADLSFANMPGADLRESDLTDADFHGANLIRANFTGANIAGANFEGALLEGVEGLQ